MSIEERFAELAQQKKAEEVKSTQRVFMAKKEIEDWIGRPYCGDYTYKEALSFIVHKYPTQEITFEECLEYIRPELKHEVLRVKDDDLVGYLTEYKASGESLKNILLLPPRGASATDGFQKDGCILFLCEESGKLSQWCEEGNTRGYASLWTELYILHNNLERALDSAKM
jgi:hypothetical protein